MSHAKYICMKLQVDSHTDIIRDVLYLYAYIPVVYPYAFIAIRIYIIMLQVDRHTVVTWELHTYVSTRTSMNKRKPIDLEFHVLYYEIYPCACPL